jgi:hypothetical protein
MVLDAPEGRNSLFGGQIYGRDSGGMGQGRAGMEVVVVRRARRVVWRCFLLVILGNLSKQFVSGR